MRHGAIILKLVGRRMIDMGDNEIELVKLYLGLEEQMKSAQISGDSVSEGLLGAKMSGIRIGYNVYNSSDWDAFDELLEAYKRESKCST